MILTEYTPKAKSGDVFCVPHQPRELVVVRIDCPDRILLRVRGQNEKQQVYCFDREEK